MDGLTISLLLSTKKWKHPKNKLEFYKRGRNLTLMYSTFKISHATKLSFCDVHIECCYQVFGIFPLARGAPA